MYAYSYMHIYTHMSYDAIACHSISCHIMPYCRIIAYDEQYSVACHINSSYHSVCVCVCYVISYELGAGGLLGRLREHVAELPRVDDLVCVGVWVCVCVCICCIVIVML